MRISSMNCNYSANSKSYPAVSCKGLIRDRSSWPIIRNMSQSDLLEFKQIEQRLSKTKFWDLKISGIGEKFKELKFHFINKKNPKHVITDGIYPYDIHGKSIKFYSIVYGPENTSFNTLETLNMPSEERAEELYHKYQQNALYLRNREYNVAPLESLKMKEVELDMLEEVSALSEENHKITKVCTDIYLKNFTGNDYSY